MFYSHQLQSIYKQDMENYPQLEDLKGQLKGRLLSDSVETLEDLDWNRVVLLDMDAEEELKTEDAERFDAVLVGG
ncbi:hypothetical protein, conserved, partial [Eimeria acervulina]